MVAFILFMLFIFALAALAPRYGVDSRRDVNTRQLEWTVRTS